MLRIVSARLRTPVARAAAGTRLRTAAAPGARAAAGTRLRTAAAALTTAAVCVAAAPGAASAQGAPPRPGAPDVAPALTAASFADPPASVRPKCRWWLPLAYEDDAQLVAELRQMEQAGAGGAEVAAFSVEGAGNNETRSWRRTAGARRPGRRS